MKVDTRRGFTLVELLVALILLVLVGGSMYKVLNTVQRVTGKQTAGAAMQGDLRAGIQLIQSELQEIATNSIAGTPTSDILSMSSTLLQYRAARGIGETCDTPTLGDIKVRKETYYGLRDPAASRDLLFIFRDRDTTIITDDEWVSSPITGVANTTCPDGDPAWGLTITALTIPIADLTSITVAPSAGLGTIPVRIYEVMEMGVVTTGGQDWLGLRSVLASEATLIPVVGPLAPSGLEFEYRAKDNSVTGTTSSVTNIRIILRGISARNVNTKMDGTIGTFTDSLMIRAQLRNSQ